MLKSSGGRWGTEHHRLSGLRGSWDGCGGSNVGHIGVTHLTSLIPFVTPKEGKPEGQEEPYQDEGPVKPSAVLTFGGEIRQTS